MLDHQILARVIRMTSREIAETLQAQLQTDYARSVAAALSAILDDVALEIGRGAAARAGTESASAEKPSLAALATQELERLATEAGLLARAAAADRAAIATHRKQPVTVATLEVALSTLSCASVGKPLSVIPLPGGFSKETYLVETTSGRQLILRRDLPLGPVNASSADEFGLLVALEERGLPVPRVIAAQKRPNPLGQPFILMERVGGENAGAASRRDTTVGRRVALGLARVLARLHSLDPAELGLPPSRGGAQEHVLAYLEGWRAYWRSRRIRACAILESAMDWLQANVPSKIDRLVPIHGDARPDNMLVGQDGEVTALLDWEFQHAGDAAEDVEYALNFVSDALPRQEFIQAYFDSGGAPYSLDRTRFYEIWRAARNLICLEASWSGFNEGSYPVFSLAAPTFLYRRHVLRDLASSLQALPTSGAGPQSLRQ